MITVTEIEEKVAEIAHHRADNEVAHQNEDELYRATLRAIAEGAPNAADLAAAALMAHDIPFGRWYA